MNILQKTGLASIILGQVVPVVAAMPMIVNRDDSYLQFGVLGGGVLTVGGIVCLVVGRKRKVRTNV